MIIKINEFTNEAASKAKGILLKDLIEKHLNEGDLQVDFTGITRFASPFFNNSFSSLALIFGFEKILSINIIGIDKTGLDVYNTSLENAKMISESSEYASEINTIVNNVPKKEGE